MWWISLPSSALDELAVPQVYLRCFWRMDRTCEVESHHHWFISL